MSSEENKSISLDEVKERLTEGKPVPVEVVKLNSLSSYDDKGAVLTPKMIIIGHVKDFPNGTSKEIAYVDAERMGERAKVTTVPNNFALNEIAGRNKQALLKSLMTHMLANPRDTLMTKYMTRVIGSDPEIFIENSDDGNIFPSFLFLEPKEKTTVKYTTNGGKILPIYNDGFQAEFQTNASYCNEIHVSSIREALVALHAAAKKFNPKAKLSIKSVIEIQQEVLSTTDPANLAFGCMPSYNAYGMSPGTLDGLTTPIRSAGGHLHFGIGQHPTERIVEIVKKLDAIIGVACVSLFASFDNPIRRNYYGLAGEYRLPTYKSETPGTPDQYGLEWRVLSNAWLMHPAIAHLVIDPARMVVALVLGGLGKAWKASETEVVETINLCDVKRARKILAKNEEFFKTILKMSYEDIGVNKGYETYLKGAEYAINDPADFETNWSIGKGQWGHNCASDYKKWASVATHLNLSETDKAK